MDAEQDLLAARKHTHTSTNTKAHTHTALLRERSEVKEGGWSGMETI